MKLIKRQPSCSCMHLRTRPVHDALNSLGQYKFIETVDASVWNKILAMNLSDNTLRRTGLGNGDDLVRKKE